MGLGCVFWGGFLGLGWDAEPWGRPPHPLSGDGCVPRHPLQMRVMVDSVGLGGRWIYAGCGISVGCQFVILLGCRGTQALAE
ncbi:hypothetical protein IFO70_17305 [Phormidium tenue FACHB-886]|nr:hypothetical protein [Phormidium tenue FACHB-886]